MKKHNELKTKHVLKTTGMFRAAGGNPLAGGGRGGRGGRGYSNRGSSVGDLSAPEPDNGASTASNDD